MATSNHPETAALPNFGNVSNVDASVEDSPAQKQEEHEIQYEDEEAEEPRLNLNTTLTHDDDDHITSLAREFSRHQSMNRTRSYRSNKDSLNRTTSQAEYGSDDPRLDPSSKSFDLPTYLKMIMRMLSQQDIDTKEAGIVIKNLNVFGSGKALNFQSTVTSLVTWPAALGGMFKKQPHKHILHENNALLKSGELLIVLGRPGAGCSTFLKTICGEQHGLIVNDDATIHYSGIEQKRMLKEFKGELVYNQEVDKHFPHLTVGETLEHAAALRLPAQQPFPQPRKEVVKHITQVIMAIFGLSHTYNTKVGNDFVRGVSGGERKRVSIAEMAMAATPIAAWDNSTRGLDSQSAFNFVKSLRFTADIGHATHCVAIYQASQAIYDLFDRAVVMYEGRQIYYGTASRAKAYFEEMGWECPARQTTGDFLTSVTNPVERKAKSGYENKVPRTPDEFATYWKKHPQYTELVKETEEYEAEYPTGNKEQLEKLRSIKKGAQGKGLVHHKSPYVATIGQQISLNTKRAWQRIWNDKPATAVQIVINIMFALIIGSVFYDTPNATVGFQAKGAVLFFAVLLNALTAISEISGLYAQRPIVEKHKSYAFYHPWTEAAAGVVLDIPVKFTTAVAFNIILYFLAGLRREPGQFFLYFLINFVTLFVMSAVFRTMAALTKTVSQAMALSGVLVLAIVVYTGFTLPIPYMHPWFSWIRYINPVFYAFEILIANEFHGQDFICSQIMMTCVMCLTTSFRGCGNGCCAGSLKAAACSSVSPTVRCGKWLSTS